MLEEVFSDKDGAAWDGADGDGAVDGDNVDGYGADGYGCGSEESTRLGFWFVVDVDGGDGRGSEVLGWLA